MELVKCITQSHKHNKCKAEFPFHVVLTLKSMMLGIEQSSEDQNSMPFALQAN